MQFGRVETKDGVRYAVREADTLRLVEGSCFDGSPRFTGEELDVAACRVLPPTSPSKILAIGRNYRAHADELGLSLGAEPSVFLKPLQTLVPHGGTVRLPPPTLSTEVEHEAEIALVIGRTARNIEPDAWQDYVVGITAADDVSARDLQRSDPHITRAKGFDTFCPLGPWINTDTHRGPEPLAVECRVNGVLRQSGTSDEMLRKPGELLAWLSSWTTLVAGDVVLTGSPAGTGPLVPGDEVEIQVSGLDPLRHGVVAASDAVAESRS